MPFDPLTGVFSPLHDWSEDRDNGLDILADRHTANDADIAAAITMALRKDGGNVPTQNLPMGGKRHTGAGAAVSPADYVIKQQLDDALFPGVSNVGDYLTTERDPGSNWLRRNGGIYAKASYPALAALLGTKYAKIAGFTLLSFGVSTDIYGIAYGAGLFVAVGGGGMIRTSANGTSWAPQVSGTTNEFKAVAFANGIFVAVATGGKIATSPDGITWTQRTSGTAVALNGIAFGNSKWVACGDGGLILVSTDNGVNWSPRPTPIGFTDKMTAAAYGNSRFVLVGGATAGVAFTSLDGDTWTASLTGSPTTHTSLAFGKGNFLAPSSAGIYMSAAGSGGWRATAAKGSTFGASFGLNNFLAVGTNYTASSLSGEAWDDHSAIAGIFTSVGVGPSFALAGGTSGSLARSNYALDTVTQFQVPADAAELGWIKAL